MADNVKALPFIGIDHPEIRQQTADYYNCIMRLDHYIGELIDALKESDNFKNTVIIYIGDHGADVPRGKRTCYEGGVRIPMIISWPGAKENQRRKELVSTLDLFPTICEIAELKKPNSLEGKSLKKIIHGENPSWRKVMATEYHVHSNHNPWPQRAIRDERFKLILNPLSGQINPGYDFTIGKKFLSASESELMNSASELVRQAYKISKRPPLYELYDLESDPYEFKNLADDSKYSEQLNKLKQLLVDWQKASRDPLISLEASKKLFDEIISAGTKKRIKINYKSLMSIKP